MARQSQPDLTRSRATQLLLSSEQEQTLHPPLCRLPNHLLGLLPAPSAACMNAEATYCYRITTPLHKYSRWNSTAFLARIRLAGDLLLCEQQPALV
ncbi:hypothetical protein CMQ_7578 [Grosmannia clavigera kw1407]|uniref:Uncharacterized protein n=1 Tax=Grosmannia clavigera (strain kw1407 / UAMH 11150) TaxID=655863 RepID=F0XQG0_GROCL|nr:uncharacterized protein CMQ_7578 [Grosmannia clavigera kw1407]EFX00576.1 hypothetical protein CMQ_7578 [Grosmannia clavigera kw1407]